jgi:3-methyladenine DNA glycosylase AlkC
MTTKFSLKDMLFNKAKVENIALELHRVYPAFTQKEFVSDVVEKFLELELKARISWIAECIKIHLPGDYKLAVGILIKALPPPNNPALTDDDFGDFIYASYAEFVAKNGCTKEHLSRSLNALYEITKRFSAEDAIRSFLNAFPNETLKVLQSWTKDTHYHVRRLCSEGTRPKLPWSQNITIPIAMPLSILDKLFSDNTRFVTRSVANHINDISKIEPDLAIDTLAKWRASQKQQPTEMDYIVRHSLRTLVKQGNQKALNMLGFSPATSVSISKFVVPRQVTMNTALEFSFTVTSEEDADVIIDYILYFQNKAGKLSGKKVYKLTTHSLTKGVPAKISKRHMLREGMTTRKLFRGRHEIVLQINGTLYGRKTFTLT